MKRLWWWLRLAAKNLWCYSGLGSMLIEYCRDCGVRQPVVWWSPNELWAELTGQPLAADMGGVLCPNCFDRRAEKHGIWLRWHPVVDYRRHGARSK